jgi:hypothetical protein
MVKAYYGGVISATPPSVSSANTSGFFNSSEHMQAVNAAVWPSAIQLIYKIYADSTYNAQGWVSASTDYIGTTGVFSFFRGSGGIQSTSGGARTNTLPYTASSKIYFELVVSSGGLGDTLIGLAGNGNSGGYNNLPCVYVNNGGGYGGYTSNLDGGLANGDILNVAYNAVTGKVFYGRNGTWSIDPVVGAGVTIPDVIPNSAAPRLIMMAGSTGGSSLGGTIKTKSGTLSYAIPSGYTTINS